MIAGRALHALVCINDQVFTFGGAFKSCEVYSLPLDVWNELEELPFDVELATAAHFSSEIWVTGWGIQKISAFDYAKNSHRLLNVKLFDLAHKFMLVHDQ